MHLHSETFSKVFRVDYASIQTRLNRFKLYCHIFKIFHRIHCFMRCLLLLCAAMTFCHACYIVYKMLRDCETLKNAYTATPMADKSDWNERTNWYQYTDVSRRYVLIIAFKKVMLPWHHAALSGGKMLRCAFSMTKHYEWTDTFTITLCHQKLGQHMLMILKIL